MNAEPQNNPKSVRLDEKALAEIDKLAEKLGVSRSVLIRLAVKKGLPKVKEALA
jgi:metal-responsive CopG/Arc/MetJ family transcriptional regulator